MRKVLSAILFVGSLAIPSIAFADIAPSISDVGSLSPPRESQIQMTKEVVQFSVPSNLVSSSNTEKPAPTMPAVATFWLKNTTDKKITQQVLFPVVFHTGTTGEIKQYAKRVRVSVNGKNISAKETKGAYDTYDSHGQMIVEQKSNGYAFTMVIPAKKTALVVVRFDAPVGYNYFNGDQPTLTYLLASGAGWSGKIGDARIEFLYPTKAKAGWVEQIESSPVATKKEVVGHAVAFVYHEFEPKQEDAPHYAFVTPKQIKRDSTAVPATTKYPGCDATHPENCP